MRLERLAVENFRPYLGRVEIEFAGPGKRNVTVIRGLNGTGKSSLFMALKWCFWGTTPVELRNLVCTAAIKAAAAGSRVETRAEVTYEHEGRRFKALRSLRATAGVHDPDQEPTYGAEPTSQFQLFEIAKTGEAKPVNTPFDELGRAVPRQALDYFFFDGEQIGRFAADNTGTSIREAVRHVLRFTELENAAKHVDLARQEYARKLRQAASPGANDLVDRREEQTKRAQTLRADVVQLGDKLEGARQLRDTYSGRLQELASVSELIGLRIQAKGQLEAGERAREDALSTATGALGSLAMGLALPALRSARATVDQKRKRGEIPAKVKTQVLRDWLEAHTCICGRTLEDGSEHWLRIKAELEKAIPSRTEEELTSLGGSIDACLREGGRQAEAARLALARLEQGRELAQRANDRLAELDAQLTDQPDEDIAAIAANERRASQDIEDLSARRMSAEIEAVRAEEEVARLTAEIAQVELRNREARRIEKKHDLAARAAHALQELRGTFEGDVRSQIETETSRLFPELIWKPQHYKAVTLSPEFRLDAIDRWNQPAFSTGETSMGESRILSLAFIVAMQIVARDSVDARTPTVVDSPFGNLSVEPIERVCARLPELVDQVVLFLTDTDWRVAEAILRPRIGKAYELEFDPDTSVTSVA